MSPIIGPAKMLSIGASIAHCQAQKTLQNLGMPRSVKVDPRKIVEAREARGWSAAELARRASLSQPTVWALEKGKTQEVKHSTLQRIAAATGKHIAFFTGGKEDNVSTDVNQYRRVPLISWVQAGRPRPAADPYHPSAPENWEDVTVAVSAETFALKVRGDSMVGPDGSGFPEGTIIIVDPNVEARNGDYVVVRFQNSDEATFKRLVVDGPLKLLRPLNPTYPTITITDDARLCGVVVEKNIRERFR